MSIIDKKTRNFTDEGSVQTMVSLEHAIAVLSKDNEYVDEVLNCFSVDRENERVIRIGNVRTLLEDIADLDSSAEKRDVRVKVRNIVLDRMLEGEAALFSLYGIDDPELCRLMGADHFQVETRYSAKDDILDLNKFSKFANHCRDKGWSDLLDYITRYVKIHTDNEDYCSARLIKPVGSEGYLLRAITSDRAYRNYGINFSVLVALLALNRYVISTKANVFVDNYQIDDSRIHLSFRLGDQVRVADNLVLSFSLILENDEIKDSSVSFNGEFRLEYLAGVRSTHIVLRPEAFRDTDERSFNTDMLNYTHSMKVENVYEKITGLPLFIEKYVGHVSEYARNIIDIKNPGEVKSFIINTVNRAKKSEFLQYKDDVLRALASIESDSIFNLFEALRNVEDLFGDDIESREYWRSKLFRMLFSRGRDEE